MYLRGEKRLAGYVMQMLGIVGDEDTVELLRGFVDDPALGAAAIESIKRLTGETA
ncbi:hypothetical protein [Amycolatopsis sp. A1MSW2902]|uniref:hypothetical protein n=1 Tax=Amycolatopsis sp. A1MSW2902 TaxID=687413 RepID=UPI00307D224D